MNSRYEAEIQILTSSSSSKNNNEKKKKSVQFSSVHLVVSVPLCCILPVV
jgi:hypothetical protein